MKEQNITLKIKELAREIAEYWRMPIYEGCWAHLPDKWNKRDFENLVLVQNKESVRNIKREMRRKESYHHWIPIPDIGDCEQKLVELGYESMNLTRRAFQNPWAIKVWDYESHDLDTDTIKASEKTGKSLHEIALSALLAALKEGSDKNNEEAYWERKKREQRKEHEYHLKMVRETEGNEPK